MSIASLMRTPRAWWLRHRGVLIAVGALLLFVLGFASRGMLSGDGQPAQVASPNGSPAGQHQGSEASIWTCAMHPQIRQPGPGKCPICGMDLVPVASAGEGMTSLRQISFSPAAKQLMSIQTMPVERRYVTAEVRMVGKVDYDETRLRHITAWVPGRLDRLYVDYTGVMVNEGDHMVYLYSPELYTAQQELMQAARAQRERAGAQSRLLSGGGGFNLLDAARDKLRLLGLSEEQIQQIEQQENPSDHTTINAPMSGIVIEKHRQEGDYVRVGERIYTLADLNQVWVKLDAYESDLQWLRYGQQVTFTTEAYPGEEFSGRVAFIDPVLNDRTRTVKVRVNVPNEQGKLKPEMFVRGVVRAEIARGGKVLDESLVGKWISPMHPEIVKDEPGTCDICGMPLVRAESLGYVPADAGQGQPPLVLPTSAVLLTGTRAIAYVEVPGHDRPTYEGREIVLGPRAGDYYLVRSGLTEGEMVVTNGNFKIDSALQIQAKPSMMTPEGGSGGGHDHGGPAGSAPESEAEGTQPGSKVIIPADFLAQVQALHVAHQALQETVEGDEISQMRAAFDRLGQTLSEVDKELLAGHALMQWNELAMLLRNDAAEGSQVAETAQAQRIAQGTERTMQRVHQQFLSSHAQHTPDGGSPPAVPEEFQQQLGELWRAYSSLQQALANDQRQAALQAVDQVQSSLAAIDAAPLSGSAAGAWARERADLLKIVATLQNAADLKALRAAFAPLSSEMQLLVQSFGLGESGPVYSLHCPMAFGNQGATWLQSDDQVRNPYFGASMLKCADRVQKIASGAPRSQEEGRPVDHAAH